MGRILKRVAHRVVRALVLKPVVGIVAALAIVAVIAFGVFSIASGSGLRLPSTPGSTSNAAEMFLRGNQTYDANLMWDSLNDDSHKRLEGSGGPQALQAQLNAARDNGVKLEQFNYIGRQDLPDGTSMQFYVVVQRSAQSAGQAEYIPYAFTIDKSGKIARVQ